MSARATEPNGATWTLKPPLLPLLCLTAVWGMSVDDANGDADFAQACGIVAALTTVNVLMLRSALAQHALHAFLVGACVHGTIGIRCHAQRRFVMGILCATILTRRWYDRCIFLPFQRGRDRLLDVGAALLLAIGAIREVGAPPSDMSLSLRMSFAVAALSHFIPDRPRTTLPPGLVREQAEK